MTELVLRALREGEVDLFESLPDPGLVGLAAFGQRYGAMAQEGEYRPEWTWVALREGRVVARAAWWGGPGDDAPRTLDWLDFTDPDAAVALLRAAPFRAEYSLTVPVDWRDHPEVRAAAEGRVDVAQRCGMRLLVERLQYVWTPSAGVPDRPGRLRFRAEPEDLAILDALRRIFVDALDAGIRRDVERLGAAEAAVEELAFLKVAAGAP